MPIKQYLRKHFPVLVESVQRFRGRDLFSGVYTGNAWNDPESRSGSGSTLANTTIVRAQLPGLLRTLRVRSMLDIPCGDFNWMKEVELGLDEYIGADVVRSLIASNQKRFGNGSTRFLVRDLLRQTLPKVDLVFCRDCLVHLSDADIFVALANIRRSAATYFLTTTFPQREENPAIATGGWRPLNLRAAPFRLPPPQRLINECYTGDGGIYADKSLGLWRTADLDQSATLRAPAARSHV